MSSRVVSVSGYDPGYPYLPYLPGESQGSNLQPSSPNLESSRVSAVDMVVLVFSSSDDRAGGTVRTARVSSVRLCTMGDFSLKKSITDF